MKGEKSLAGDRQQIEEFLAMNGFKCPNGMSIISIADRRAVINVDVTSLTNRYGSKRIYNSYGEVIGVYFEKEYFAIPKTKKNIHIIQSFGFMKDPSFFFYLNENEYPMDEELRQMWYEVTIRGSKERKEEFAEECKRWAEINKIKPVPKTELARCLLIPESGIRVRDANNEYDDRTYYPIVSYLNPQSISEIGFYSAYENRIMFVDYDGKTYIGKGYYLVNILNSLNYRTFSYYLPIRANEIILDKDLRSAWEAIPENHSCFF